MTPETKRRKSILLSVALEPGLGVKKIRHELEFVHFIAASHDVVRADLLWLSELGLVKFADDTAMATERGIDIAQSRAGFPF